MIVQQGNMTLHAGDSLEKNIRDIVKGLDISEADLAEHGIEDIRDLVSQIAQESGYADPYSPEGSEQMHNLASVEDAIANESVAAATFTVPEWISSQFKSEYHDSTQSPITALVGKPGEHDGARTGSDGRRVGGSSSDYTDQMTAGKPDPAAEAAYVHPKGSQAVPSWMNDGLTRLNLLNQFIVGELQDAADSQYRNDRIQDYFSVGNQVERAMIGELGKERAKKLGHDVQLEWKGLQKDLSRLGALCEASNRGQLSPEHEAMKARLESSLPNRWSEFLYGNSEHKGYAIYVYNEDQSTEIMDDIFMQSLEEDWAGVLSSGKPMPPLLSDIEAALRTDTVMEIDKIVEIYEDIPSGSTDARLRYLIGNTYG
ncbi:hypothetical protein KJ708_12630, partial [bacterium]|nr:hypothetical protein [bacterium]